MNHYGKRFVHEYFYVKPLSINKTQLSIENHANNFAITYVKALSAIISVLNKSFYTKTKTLTKRFEPI